MNEQLREDNDALNCAVHSDPPNKIGRAHYWQWQNSESFYRQCTTCGRVEWNNRIRPPRADERPMA